MERRFVAPLLAAAAFLLLLAFASASSDDIAGCGGFVRLSKELQSKSKLPYESIHVELVSADGELVKERAECAPNGYYFLPIYDKGSFNMRVHGPEGWNFEPSSVLIDEGRCDSSRDYNFIVTGFVLSGTVRSLGQSSAEGQKGPAGVVITLKNKANAKVADQSTTTGQDGAFHFNNVFPGTYEIVASHPSWTFIKDRTEVSFEWDNVRVKDELLVGGFEVSGSVQSVDENAAVPGVDFILYSASDLKDLPLSCSTDGVSGAPEEKGLKAVCGARSDAAGRFVIKGVPCGQYTLVPHYRSSNTNYDLLPSRVDVTVSHANTEVSEPFRVAGFSVEGRVVDVDGEGISGATVLFDGVEKATTDADGHYRIEKVRVGSYAVEVVKDHVFFDALKSVQLSPSKAQVPQIKAASYHLCGRVSLSSGRADEKQKPGHRDVLLVDAVSGREERRSTDPTGAFCFEVVPGRYRVTPVISAAEERAGLLFVPAKREVTLNKSPVLDVNFGQALVTVQGVVRCLEAPCDPSISITLTGTDIESHMTASLSPGEKQEATYAIRDVLPGQYEVQIKHESWCWKQTTHKLNVKAEAETGKSHIQAPEFVHEGYQLSSVVSHDVKLVASLDSAPKERQTFELTKGTNRFCLNKPGVYTLTPVSCYKFERDTYKYDTANPRLLDLQATHYLLNASVLAAEPASNITLHVAVDHSQKAGRKDAAHEEYHVSTSEEQHSVEGGKHQYGFAIWVAPGDKLTLTPKASTGSDLLFYPSSTTFTLSKPECPSPLAPFQARPGSYVNGRVEPAIANVRISVYTTGEDGERRLVSESTTAASGNYSIGPLPDNTHYEIEAAHEGYYFKQTETGVFHTQKLGTVAVTVKDEAGNALPGVVISLSGEGYRSNNPTNPQGVFTVSALHPGSYYLRPLLKEYVFTPSATSVEVKEGLDEKVTISAKRVAYSCFGKVRSLNGEAEKFVPVEAVSATGEVEETQTDAEGNFRLRGLQPGKEYRVRVKATADQRIERAAPSDGYLVKLAANEALTDVQNQDFLVFRRLPKTDLTGEVTAEPHVLSTLKVEVFEDGKSEVVKSVGLGPSTFFNAGPLNRDAKYRVRLSSSLSSRSYSHAPQEVLVDLDSAKHLKLNFTATMHDPLRHDLTSTPIFSFILAVLLIALVYFHKLALEVGKAALSGDINAVRGLLRPKAEEEEDSATSFLSPHHLHPAKVGRAGARKNASRPGYRPSRS